MGDAERKGGERERERMGHIRTWKRELGAIRKRERERELYKRELEDAKKERGRMGYTRMWKRKWGNIKI